MRIRVVAALAASLLAGEAAAASILQVEGDGASSSRSVMVISAMPAGRSVDVLADGGVAETSRSVVVLGEPPVSQERVAAIGGGATPSVLRGGVYGEALPAPVAEPEPVKKPSRPALRAKERAERRAIREAARFGEPLPQKAETQPETGQGSGS